MVPFKKPKIAILTVRNSYNYGGILSTLKVTYQFCQNYFEPKVFFLGFDHEIATSLRRLKFTSSVKPLSYFGMNCIEVGARWAFWEPGHYSFTYRHWKTLLKDYDYFFVVSGTCMAAHPLMLLHKKFTMWIGTPYNEDRAERVKELDGVRYVLNQLAHQKMNAIEKKILSRSSFTWAISTYAKSKFEYILGHTRDTMVLCGYPIDCSKVSVVKKGGSEKIIIAVGRFSDPRKNIDMLFRVFDKLYQQMSDIKLYIVGKKPLDEKLTQFSSLPSFQNIIFTGQIAGDDLFSLYRRAHLMLITSYQEGLGIVGLEALLHGTPVVATDCGGTRDYVVNNISGFLVPINNDDEMVAHAYAVLSDDQLRERLAQGGRQLVEEIFAIGKIYALFKRGLVVAYPELQKWFEERDRMTKLLHERKTNVYLAQDIV